MKTQIEQSSKKMNDLWKSLHVAEETSLVCGFYYSLALKSKLASTLLTLREILSILANGERISVS